jgi:6-phospho-3-hexuloisomerase
MTEPLHEAESALGSIRAALAEVDRSALDALIEAIDRSPSVFLSGAGRTGLMVRAFGMRLAQMGLRVHVVGETTTPAIGAGELLVACSASGRKDTVLATARIARDAGGRVAAITTDPASPLAEAAHTTLALPTPEPDASGPAPPLGTLLEYMLLVLLDSIVGALMERRGISEEEMRRRHANLE